MILTDDQIEELIKSEKPLPEGYRSKLFPEKDGKRQVVVFDTEGRQFTIIIRQNKKYPDNFSVLLMYTLPQTNNLFCLRRYNSWEIHNNLIEEEKLLGYHIHMATERYQLAGRKAESFAVKTERYSNPREAFSCLVDDCNFKRPASESTPLLEYTNQ